MTIDRLRCLLFVLLLAGCTSPAHRSTVFVPEDQFELQVSTEFDEQVFSVALVSKSDSAMCIDADQWPNRRGNLHMGSLRARVVDAGREFPAVDENFGYCVGSACDIRIEPSARLEGRIAFSTFEGWTQRTSSARLIFSVRPRRC
ncbi:MAG: hypothetical protein AB7Q23_12230 [Hyphomonadaceae bacterium]